MKNIRLFTIVTLLSLVMTIFVGSSCTNSSTDKKELKLDTIAGPNRADTMRVMDVTKKFMDLMVAQNVDSALNMLSYQHNDSADYLTPAMKEELKKQFRLFPVKSYEVLTSDFKSHYKAYVTYKYMFMDNPTNDPNYPCTMNLRLDVKYISSEYRLLLQTEGKITR